MPKFVLAFTFLIIHFSGIATANEVTSRVKNIYKNISKSYQADSAKEAVTIAVLPYQTSKKLEQMRAGRAVSEILTHYFARDRNYIVVERHELEKILKEQWLGLTGVTDDNNVIKVGKLLNAQLLIVGSILKVGKSYHINSRMVNVETGKVVATDLVSVASDEFEEEARPYLFIFPKRHFIGLYGTISMWRINVSLTNDLHLTENSFSTTLPGTFRLDGVPGEISKNLILTGVGLRYFPIKTIMVDMSVNFYESTAIKEENFTFSTNGQRFVEEDRIEISIKNLFNGNVNYVWNFHKKQRFMGGIGISYFEIKVSQELRVRSNFPSKSASALAGFGEAKLRDRFFIPSLRFGYEFRPGKKWGINLLANYLLPTHGPTILDPDIILSHSSGPQSNLNFKGLSLNIDNDILFNSAIVYYF